MAAPLQPLSIKVQNTPDGKCTELKKPVKILTGFFLHCMKKAPVETGAAMKPDRFTILVKSEQI